MRFVRAISLLLSICLSAAAVALAACHEKPAHSAAPAKSPTLHVLAAASLADAFREVGAAFEKSHAGTKVEFGFGGSNQLRTQLENGAPGDVFASADRTQMDAAAQSKVVDAATVRVFCTNRLAVVVPRENKAGIKALADLGKSDTKIVVADKTVPAGNYTRFMLEKAKSLPAPFGAGFVEVFDKNTVSREENVAAVAAKIALGEADAGIAYASDAAGGNAAKLTVIALPPALEQRAEYAIAVTTRAADQAVAAEFIEFVRGADGQAILVKRGFGTAEAGTP